jgi:hypothetical protein
MRVLRTCELHWKFAQSQLVGVDKRIGLLSPNETLQHWRIGEYKPTP